MWTLEGSQPLACIYHIEGDGSDLSGKLFKEGPGKTGYKVTKRITCHGPIGPHHYSYPASFLGQEPLVPPVVGSSGEAAIIIQLKKQSIKPSLDNLSLYP